jgi:penicillin G amidase
VRPDHLVGAALLLPHLTPSIVRRRRRLTLEDRLGMVPRTGIPVTATVVVHRNRHQIPFIEAKSDHDVAVALGIVHAHLRLGQRRRLSQGRVAEWLSMNTGAHYLIAQTL